MKYVLSVVFLMLIAIGLNGQEAPKIKKIINTSEGSWVNLHQKTDELIGVKVQQFPDNPYTSSKYEGKHPSMVIYVFKSMKAHQIEYNPNGSIKAGFWWEIKKDHSILKQVKKIKNSN